MGKVCEAHSHVTQVESQRLGGDELPEATELGSDLPGLTSAVPSPDHQDCPSDYAEGRDGGKACHF